MSEADLKGLPKDYKTTHIQEDSTYKIGMSYPDSGPFFRMAKSDDARKQLKEKYDNRAADTNLPILLSMIGKRDEMAKILGYNTFADYVLDDRVAKTSQTVWNFEKKLKNKLRSKAEMDMNEMLAFKSTAGLEGTEIKPWEYSYIKERLLSEKYGVDNEKVKEFFELENVKKGLFAITQNLFGLEYKKIDAPVHTDVDVYEVYQEDQMIGRFYLDLYPRPNKYGHAACFSLVKPKQLDGIYQNPSATLVCNFPAATATKPSLMTHDNVETFFHEFGHVLHNLLSKTVLSSQGGTSVSKDFVEAPSQIFENWAWNYEALSLFAQHYETGETIPRALFDKMLAAKNVLSGLDALRQVHYGTYDLTLYDGYEFKGEESTSDLWHAIYKDNTMIASIPNTSPQASFGHLNGYAAGYYGYMWSLVYAQDMFSVFEKNGIMNPEVGKRYRDEVLSQGGSKDEMEMLINFLGREPNEGSFIKSLGL